MTKLTLTLLKNPLIKIIGVGVIIYYALLNNNYGPDSLKNRLSKERINENIKEVKKNSLYIAQNLQDAELQSKQQKLSVSKKINSKKEIEHENNNNVNLDPKIQKAINKNTGRLIVQDIKNGQGTKISCGDQITISYLVNDNLGNKIDQVLNKDIVINSEAEESVIKENILGLQEGSQRAIIVPENHKTKDPLSLKYINSRKNAYGITYIIDVVKVTNLKSQEKCNWKNDVILADKLIPNQVN